MGVTIYFLSVLSDGRLERFPVGIIGKHPGKLLPGMFLRLYIDLQWHNPPHGLGPLLSSGLECMRLYLTRLWLAIRLNAGGERTVTHSSRHTLVTPTHTVGGHR